ncbi:MAG: DIP1984 family protein [Cellulosilyticum sp.]|nr:DIP1984 family protein [Cellulosilyticum sp.]
MKLAEALMLRADYQTKIYDLKQRISNNTKIQDGEEVSEDPAELFKMLDETLSNLEDIIIRINNTNSKVFVDDQHTLGDLIVKRDTLKKSINIYTNILQNATIKYDRMMRTEIKYVTTINIANLQKQVDDLSKEFRELNVKLQEKNWTTDLL